MLTKGVIEEDAVAGSLRQGEQKAKRLVKRIRRFLPAISVGVPHGERLIAMVERSGFVTETKIVLLPGHRASHGEFIAFPGDGSTVAGDQRPIRSPEADQGIAPIH